MKSAAARGFSSKGKTLYGRFRVLDYFVFCLAAAAFVVSMILIYGGGMAGTADARVAVNGRDGAWLYPLESSETLVVTGPLGDTVVAVNSGKAWIVSSPCRNQTCIASPPVHRRGQWIACLPNQVMVSVDSRGAAASDAPEGKNLIDGLSW
jgi:hypothetical protein